MVNRFLCTHSRLLTKNPFTFVRFTKARTDKGKCTISEYMDTISRNGANFFEMKKDLKFNDNMDAPSV